MYIAEMFMYGQDQFYVGVNGIRSCMGVFAVHNKRLFAIHVPSTTESSKTGRQAFAKYFYDKNPGYDGGAKLYAFTKLNERGEHVEEEVREWEHSLDAGETTLVMITADPSFAAGVMCERLPSGNDVNLWYKKNDDVVWGTGTGTMRDGKYLGALDVEDPRYSIDPRSLTQWSPFVNNVNALIKSLNAPLTGDVSLIVPSNKSKGCSIM
jgi:hypothetical protein